MRRSHWTTTTCTLAAAAGLFAAGAGCETAKDNPRATGALAGAGAGALAGSAIAGKGATIARSGDSGTPEFRIFHVVGTGFLNLNNLTVQNGRSGAGAGSQ